MHISEMWSCAICSAISTEYGVQYVKLITSVMYVSQ
jgi:hypothetical protein